MPAPTTRATEKTRFTSEELTQGLNELSNRLLQIWPRLPRLTIIITGGFIACSRWQIRRKTHGLDYIALRSSVPDEVNTMIKQVAAQIAADWNWKPDWISDGWKMFLPEDGDEDEEVDQSFLEDCVRQGVVVYNQGVFCAYAILWEWELASKIDRQFDDDLERPPRHDLDDLVYLLREIVVRRQNRPLSYRDIQTICATWYKSERWPMMDTVDWIGEQYENRFGEVGLLMLTRATR